MNQPTLRASGPIPSGRRPRRDPPSPWIGIHLGVAVLTAIVLAPCRSRGLMLFDVGELSFYVHKIQAGLLPGQDYVVNGYGPGRYYLLAWLSPLLGPFLDTYWTTVLVLRIAISGLALELGRRLLPGLWPALPVLCLLVAPGPFHKGFFVAGSLGLALALVHYLAAPSRGRAFGLGLVLVAVGLFRLDLGLFGLLSAAIVCLSGEGRRAHLMAVLIPGALLLLFAFETLEAMGQGTALLVASQVLDDALVNQRITDPSFPSLGALLRFDDLDPWFLWLPLLVYGLAAVRWRRSSFSVTGESMVFLLGLLACNQIRMKPEYGHFLQAAPLLYVTVTLLLAGAFRSLAPPLGKFLLPAGRLGPVAARGRLLAVGLVVLGVSLPALLAAHSLGKHRGSVYTGSFTISWERNSRLETPLGPAWLNQGEFDGLAPMLSWLEAAPPGAIWVPTHQPLYYGLTGRADVSGLPSLLYYANNEARQTKLLARLDAAAPPIAIFVDDTVEGPEMRLALAAPRVHRYLAERYQEVARFGPNRVMTLRRTGKPTPQ